MGAYIISADSKAADLKPVAMAINAIIKMPVTARSKNHKGIYIENGKVIDEDYSGPVLEEVLRINETINKIPKEGGFKGVPVIVAPIRNEEGEAVGALGIVDFTGVFDLATLMEHQSEIIKQVCGKDPCPLPGESIGAKR
ncbi:MAG: DUF2111 domain-containing protein [Methanomicrobiaceae archaeon]|nr:DUF2111 domain-containing protein [Methanomicrobiaceae archaeon]